MIFFLAPQAGAFGMRDYLQLFGDGLREHVRVLTYEELFARGALPAGSYIFSGLDQLTRTEIDLVVRARHELARAVPAARLLNDPGRVLQRYELLRTMFEMGRNAFRVTRASDLCRHHRFPVFVRSSTPGSAVRVLPATARHGWYTPNARFFMPGSA